MWKHQLANKSLSLIVLLFNAIQYLNATAYVMRVLFIYLCIYFWFPLNLIFIVFFSITI